MPSRKSKKVKIEEIKVKEGKEEESEDEEESEIDESEEEEVEDENEEESESEEEEESENEDQKDDISPLKTCIEEAEKILFSIEGDLSRISRMKTTFQQMIKCGLFEAKELDEYNESYKFHATRQNQNIITIVNKVNEAKEIWDKKTELMGKWWKEGVLDEGVVKKWKISMSEYENRIDEIDKKLQFWCNNEKKSSKK